MAMTREDWLSAQVCQLLTIWEAQGRFCGISFHVGNETTVSISGEGQANIALRLKRFKDKRRQIGIVPGVLDWLVMWTAADGTPGRGLIELKTPQGYYTSPKTGEWIKNPKEPRGKLSPEQIAFMAKCAAFKIPTAVCETIEEVEKTLISWGALK